MTTRWTRHHWRWPHSATTRERKVEKVKKIKILLQNFYFDFYIIIIIFNYYDLFIFLFYDETTKFN
jgi:hypothetical protein